MHSRIRQTTLMLRAITFNAYEPTEHSSEFKYEEDEIDWEQVAREYSLFRLLRRLLAVSCCLVTVLSFAAFILSIKLYIDRNEIFSEHKVYAGRESWKLIIPSFNNELSFCYFIIAASLLAWMVSLCGFIGACNNKQLVLLQYVLLSILIISLSAAAITYNIRGKNKTLDVAIERMFEVSRQPTMRTFT
ncbi:hypothetical protein M514_20238 [Trichuris suis]|uniref:Tetraspanin family protein n=1 Tax=Trichuris suis TaxID=68888 RepID=A0A085NDL5_9BILA|nr:hypothetical protein M514_20238 [Trichuris suis]